MRVTIPARVMAFIEPGDVLRSDVNAATASFTALTLQGAGPPSSPPYCDEPGADPELCLRVEPPIDDTTVVFDLRCATYGPVPVHCASTYPYPETPEGRFLDIDGRPYPPVPEDADGNPIDKHFPQFFEHPSMRLHVYSNDHPGGWVLSVDMVDEPTDQLSDTTIGRANFAVRALQTGGGAWGVSPGPGERDPTWKCFAFHPAWPGSHVCPAPQGDDGVILAERTSRGWHNFTLGIKLLLDGSESPGIYQGLLRYTVVTF